MRFFLGTHRPNWLARTTVPLFVSDRTLRIYKTLPHATATWALDSGGFTELSQHGTGPPAPARASTPTGYGATATRSAEWCGRHRRTGCVNHSSPIAPVSPCLSTSTAPWRTSSTSARSPRTCPSLLSCRAGPRATIWPAPEMYDDAGVDLAAESTVGIGSVCRREGTNEAAEIIAAVCVAVPGIRLHGFGIKTSGLGKYGSMLASSDSMAWSMAARRQPALPGCSGHKNCANCPRFAFQWRERVLASLARHATYTSTQGRSRVSRKVDTLSATEQLALAAFDASAQTSDSATPSITPTPTG